MSDSISISVCAGIGGFDLAFERAGMTTDFQVEIDDNCNAVLARHFPNSDRSIRDICDVTRERINGKKVLAVVGGTPCQGFSFAGLRGSLEDQRSNLCFQFCRIADELESTFIVWENVPGVLSTPDNAFGCFLAAIVGADAPLVPPKSTGRWRTKLECNENCGESCDHEKHEVEYFAWSDAGYVVGPKRCAAWRILDTQFFDIPQRRERVVLVADSGNGSCAEILFERKGVSGNNPTGGKTGEEVAGTLGAHTSGGWGGDLDGNGAFIDDERPNRISPTITAGAHPGGFNGQDVNHLVVPSVTTKWAKGSGGPAGDECQNLVLAINTAHTKQNGSGISENVAHTLDSNPQAVTAFPARMSGTQCASTENISPSLTAHNPTAIAFEMKDGKSDALAPTLRARNSVDANQTGHGDAAVMANEAVRRLTPTECERLQGFPDAWTEYGVDSNGCKVSMADGPRYKMLGNAVTVAVFQWVAERLKKFCPQE